MDPSVYNDDMYTMATFILLLLLASNRELQSLMIVDGNEEEDACMTTKEQTWPCAADELERQAEEVFHHFRLWCGVVYFDEDTGFWVKPRSKTWVTKFLLEEYNNEGWIHMFRMTKRSVVHLSELLRPSIEKHDTNYRLAIPVTIRVACTLFKLCHGSTLMICSELFVIGVSTVSQVLREVVLAVNEPLRGEIQWPGAEDLVEIASGFQELCGLPSVLGAIDGTHIAICKPRIGASDYYYFKSGGYSMHVQAVVDSNKRFMDLYRGMPGSTNDSRVLWRSTPYMRGHAGTLWDPTITSQGFSPYLLGNAQYPLLSWIMVPHRRIVPLPLASVLFNRRLSKRSVVENAFADLKNSFRELRSKSALHISFLPQVVLCCATLHNVLLKQSHEEVERLLNIIGNDNSSSVAPTETADTASSADVPNFEGRNEAGVLKQQELGIFLSTGRVLTQ